MRYYILIFIAFIYGCENQAQTNKIDLHGKKIINKLSKDYSQIPGTKVYLIIPSGFKLSSRITGIEKNDNTGINIMDLQGGSFNSNAKNYTKENFESKGINVKEFYEFSINGFKARLARLQGDPTAESYQMVLGDSTFSVAFMAVFLSSDSISASQIKNCFVNAIYDKNLKIDPFKTARFDIDFKNSKMKFAKFGANMYMFSTNGVDNPDDYPDGAMFMVSQLPSDPSYMQNLKNTSDLMLAGMKKYGLTDFEAKLEGIVFFNGNKAYKYIGFGKKGLDKTLVYQVVTGNSNVILMIIGTAKSDFENNIKVYDDLTNTIKLK